MDRLDLKELEREAARSCPLFWTGPRLSAEPDVKGRSPLAQAILDNQSANLRARRRQKRDERQRNQTGK
jgi:hypothetical protein